jgi:hypothetical protein
MDTFYDIVLTHDSGPWRPDTERALAVWFGGEARLHMVITKNADLAAQNARIAGHHAWLSSRTPSAEDAR